MPFIYIVPIGLEDPSFLKPIVDVMVRVFHLNAKVCELPIDLASTYDIARNQYNSSLILLQLIKNPPSDALKILGVTEVDLFIPIFTFVFGEAQLDGVGAVVSLHRLNNRFYGLPEDKKLLIERFIKEALHELGHTFGSRHCLRPQCVMNFSTYVENIDQKSAEFCSSCQKNIKIKEKLNQKFIRRIKQKMGF